MATRQRDVPDQLGFEVVDDVLDGLDLTEAESAAIDSRLAHLLDRHGRALARSASTVSSNVGQYRNRWIAVGDDGSIVAHEASFEALDETLSNLPALHVVIRRMPAADEPLFIGLR
jgi:hypothetical protein